MTIPLMMTDTRMSRSEPLPTHLAQFYDEGAFPDRAIADFLGEGLRADESIVIIATPDHAFLLGAHLAKQSAALSSLERSGRLTILDAQTTLDQFMDGAMLDRTRVNSILAPVLAQAAAAAPSGRGSAFGEMVALLSTQGNLAAAIELERAWNDLLRANSFRLYCAYPIRQFVHESMSEFFQHVCNEHDEVVPVLTWLDKPEQQGRWLAILQQQSHALQVEIAERTAVEAELRASQEQLRELSAHLQSAREEERARLARELHDELGQVLTALKMDLTRWSRRFTHAASDPDQAATLGEVQDMKQLADDAINSMRRILKELRPVELDTLGLMPALDSHVQDFQNRTGIEAHFVTDVNDLPFESTCALALFRIVQESLTNVARHARATRVDVILVRDESRLVLEVRDNGEGMTTREPHARGHMGIVGMRERVLLLGGSLEIQGSPQQGTTVVVSIPFESCTAVSV